MKMVTDLERIGDLAVNIAERAVALSGERPRAFASLITRLGELDQAQLRAAIEAFVARDAAAAEKVCAEDDKVDKLYWELTQEVQKTMTSDPVLVERGVHLQAAAKFLERIGDHITNLAELVIFLVKGKDIRHLGKLDDL
jgi:phosphate transport system protein